MATALLFLALQTLCHALWRTGQLDPLTSAIVGSVSTSIYAWTTIGALCGDAQAHFNESSALLAHLNEAVLPVYVLHRPILLIGAYLSFPMQLPLALESGLVDLQHRVRRICDL